MVGGRRWLGLGLLLALLLSHGVRPWVWAKKNPTAPPVATRSDEVLTYVTLQAGTRLLCVAETPIHTAHNAVNDPVEARLVHPVYWRDRVLLPASVRLVGSISQLGLPIAGRDAELTLRFSQVQLSPDVSLPIKAHIDAGDGKRGWGGDLTAGSQWKAVQYNVMGIGTYNRHVDTGPRLMGRHYKVEPGEYWLIVLEEPLTVPVVNRWLFTP